MPIVTRSGVTIHQAKTVGDVRWPGRTTRSERQRPQDPVLLSMLAGHNCYPEVGENDCYDLVHRTGSYIELGYGASFQEWEEAAIQLDTHG